MLDARQLDALVAVVEHGSFGAAAAALKLTLAAVSLRIKALEDVMGQRLLVRGKAVHATPAGQALLAHVRQVRLMEAELLDARDGAGAGRLRSLSVAVNADSLSSWFLAGVAAPIRQYHVLLDIVVDDQDHTHDALKSGDVTGCVTTLPQAMRGCVAEPLGLMRYRCMAAPALLAGFKGRAVQGAVTAHQLLQTPAVIFNRKDALQDAFLAQHFGLRHAGYPRHFVPGWTLLNWPLSWAWAGAWCPTCCWPSAAIVRRWPRCCRAGLLTWRCIGSIGRVSRCWRKGSRGRSGRPPQPGCFRFEARRADG